MTKPWVVIAIKGGSFYSARFATKQAASAAAEFWSISGAAAVLLDDYESVMSGIEEDEAQSTPQ